MSEKLNFEKLPEVVQQLSDDISDLKRILLSTPSKQTNRLMILEEAAEYLHLSKPTIYRLVSERTIPFHKQGGRLWFLEAELLEWVKGGR
jgi:excisionase family DNA binding protein